MNKPCRLSYKGTRYQINSDGSVERLNISLDAGSSFIERACQESTRELIQFVPVDEFTSLSVKAEAKRLRHNRNRRERDQAMRDLGLVRVRGNLGGVYWE
jgi:hypothetical protein